MRFILLAAQLILLDATQSAVTVGLDAFGIEVKITPDVSKDGDEGVECREDWQCPMARPICDRARLLCEDLYYFNSSRGSCVCDSPHDCDFEEILTQEVLSNVSDCVFACKVTPECRAFQGRYIPNSHKSNFSCQLLRALSSSSTPATLTGDGQGDQYCYRKPDRSSECTHHLACLTSSGQ
ncbi:unnamed protein product [Effrenium voratum]|nr:unnamed protein product [Effrenium voratum]